MGFAGLMDVQITRVRAQQRNRSEFPLEIDEPTLFLAACVAGLVLNFTNVECHFDPRSPCH